MKTLTDDQIRDLAKQAGWWSVYEGWWEQEIPRLRKFLELANSQCVHPLSSVKPVRVCHVCGKNLDGK